MFTSSGEDLSWLLKQWKTVNMDVDARGRPCKERMLQILLRYKNFEEIVVVLWLDPIGFVPDPGLTFLFILVPDPGRIGP
jgi:hypothetical protein